MYWGGGGELQKFLTPLFPHLVSILRTPSNSFEAVTTPVKVGLLETLPLVRI